MNTLGIELKKPLAHRIVEALADNALDRRVVDVRLGLKAVGVQLDNGTLGIAYRFLKDTCCDDISSLGTKPLTGRKASELLSWLCAENPLKRSVGLAVANTLTSGQIKELDNKRLLDGDVLSAFKLTGDERIAMIGYFVPIVEKIRNRCSLEIFELDTTPGPELRDSAEAPEGLRRCDIALITSTTIVNGTIDRLLDAAVDCREVVMLGPSTPLLPEVFSETPVTMLSGIVIDDDVVLRVVSEGGSMRQLLPYVQKVNLRSYRKASLNFFEMSKKSV